MNNLFKLVGNCIAIGAAHVAFIFVETVHFINQAVADMEERKE